ncbi:MAG: hypothetical protein JRI87_00975, partial [Deltaproteobacteria bacterium]|nr:hypothetical protein [Deltaproteobacteria bacterium]
MKKGIIVSIALLLLAACILYFVILKKPATATQECVCSDGTVHTQDCRV